MTIGWIFSWTHFASIHELFQFYFFYAALENLENTKLCQFSDSNEKHDLVHKYMTFTIHWPLTKKGPIVTFALNLAI